MPNDDSRLLASFVQGSDPEAFASLVARLGPAVLRVCRTVVDDDHLAEDAFQATFLILFRKAHEIQDPDRLRGWLCGTAYKTAARVRRRAIRLAARERPASVEAAYQSPDSDHDIFIILREELGQLPDKYRAPLILCYLEGLTHQQAAEQLEWATGTVKVRLVRGKRLLRERLDRRKVALAGVLIALWRREAAAAAPGLVETTIRATDLMSAMHEPDAQTAPGWAALRNASLAILIAVAAAATAAGAVVRLSPTLITGEEDHVDLPANLTDLLRSDCS